MTTSQYVMIVVAVFSAGFVQVLAGFGFSLLCMPLMTITVPVPQAVVVSALLGVATSTWQAWRLRADQDRPLRRRLVAWAHLGMPLGLVILNVVDETAMRVVLGVAVLLATALLARQIDLAHVGNNLDRVCGFLSGVLNTSLSTNGPPLVFDLHARGLDPQRFRATITATFAWCNPVAIALFAVDGKLNRSGLVAAALAMPAVAAGQALAWPVHRHIHGERFRWLVLGLLFTAGASAIVFALT